MTTSMIEERLWQAFNNRQAITITVRTGKHETMEVPMCFSQTKENNRSTDEYYSIVSRYDQTIGVNKTVITRDANLNRTTISEEYSIANIENILVSVGN